MRRLSWMACFALLCAAPARATLLTNGALEEPQINESDLATGWTLIEPTLDDEGGAVNSATFVLGFGNHTAGGNRGLWFRSFEGGAPFPSPPTVEAHLTQDVAGVAGGDYTLSAWFRFEPNYSGLEPATPTQTILALEFRNGGGLLGVVDLEADAAYDTSLGAANTWQRFEIGGVAPPGTTIVRARVSMLDGLRQPLNPQSGFVDDVELTGPMASIVAIPTLSTLAAGLFALALAAVALRQLAVR